MKKLILLAMIGATLSLAGCANQGQTTTSASAGAPAVAAGGGGVSGGGGGSPQMPHTPTKHIP